MCIHANEIQDLNKSVQNNELNQVGTSAHFKPTLRHYITM